MFSHLSLFAGYDGLGMAVNAAFDATTTAYSEIDPGATAILKHRLPGVENLGDITTADFAPFAGKIDIISGGSPCQSLSHAGRRAGMTQGATSNLWVAMREAIAVVRPSLVVWENVRGAFSAKADSALEQCPRCVGEQSEPVVLRALGRVLGDLSDLGYDARWYGLRASDIGAAHHRFRVFVFAYRPDASSHPWRVGHRDAGIDRATELAHLESPQHYFPTPAAGAFNDAEDVSAWLARRERVKLTAKNGNGMGMPLAIAAKMLPTPQANLGTNGSGMLPHLRRQGGHSVSLEDAVQLFPTPRASDHTGASIHGRGGGDLRTVVTELLPVEPLGNLVQDWQEYEPAIRRQEAVFGFPAPLPTELNRNGAPRLSARFAEWLMGLPPGWVTDVPDVVRTGQLKAIGNGVVPQQAYAAAQAFIRDMAAS